MSTTGYAYAFFAASTTILALVFSELSRLIPGLRGSPAVISGVRINAEF